MGSRTHFLNEKHATFQRVLAKREALGPPVPGEWTPERRKLWEAFSREKIKGGMFKRPRPKLALVPKRR